MKTTEEIINGILFEDNHMIVAVKPAGVLSQADQSGDLDMLTVIKKYIKVKYNKPGNVYLGLLHRLDRPVSGVMVFAKTSKCAARISAQIRDRTVIKRYRAVVYNHILPEQSTLKHYIKKDTKNNKAYSSQEDQGKEAVLHYCRLSIAKCIIADREREVSLVEIDLKTGRAHQIRFQLSDIGYPIVGDKKYNADDQYRGDICLESYYLELNHPVSNERMNFEIPVRQARPWNVFSDVYEENIANAKEEKFNG